jgi:HD-like signal output (HDOD) protein
MHYFMHGESKKTAYEEALNKVEKLYSSPLILSQAASLIQKPEIQIEDVVKLINADAALTADIIKMSNSPTYSFGERVGNLSGAIKRIGFGRVTRIIGLSVLKKMSQSDLSHYKIAQNDFWEESISMAIIMEMLGVYGGLNPSDTYTMGLLHNIGKIVLNQIMEDNGLDVFWDGSKSVDEWEKEVIGFTYPYAGAMLLKRWRFPETTCHPILYQLHSPKEKVPWKMHTCIYFGKQIIGIAGKGFRNANTDFSGIEQNLTAMGIELGSMGEIMEMSRQHFLEIKNTVDAI